MTMLFRSHAPWLAILALTLLAVPVFAQVPQDMTYTGRLVDNMGDPLTGPVDLQLRIFDSETGPAQIYNEDHLGVSLDGTGGFSVQLGLGTSPSGPFDADIFSDVDRWLEVEVDSEVLIPRQIIGSVPWALIAQQATEVVPDPNAPRFEDCGDGTVADHHTGLLWEKKTGVIGSPVLCKPGPVPGTPVDCPDPHVVNNKYRWSSTETAPDAPDGNAFTDFLAKLNDPVLGEASEAEAVGDPAADPTGCFAAHCDWRLPIIGELRTILIGRDAAPGQAPTCSNPCIDPEFAAVGGPIAGEFNWSASTLAGSPNDVWGADFGGGTVFDGGKLDLARLRAVRVGSCN